MRLYYHHVGQQGADQDFPKTVFRSRRIAELVQGIPASEPHKAPLIAELQHAFPSGEFNCWGVPSGADRVINSLSPGDVVLLVESAHITGRVPALCQVAVFQPHEFPTLSALLWGSPKYPYIFFFSTERITLQWIRFIDHLGYAENFDPRGKFYSVALSRLEPLGGAEGYVQLLRNQFGMGSDYPLLNPDEVKNVLKDETPQYLANVNRAIQSLQKMSVTGDPTLTGSSKITQRSVVKTTARDQAFRLVVRQLYDSTCAICGIRLTTPDGTAEAQAAHIYPKRLDGADDFRNGVCLCRLHHWALDCGWISVADDLTVLGRQDLPRTDHFGAIHQYIGRRLRSPSDARFVPHPLYLKGHRGLHGFDG